MRIRLLADENVAFQKVERLRDLGHDIVSVADLGLAGQKVPDKTVLQIAASQGRIVLTHNGKDFKRLHARDTDHAGIMILPDDVRHALIAESASVLLEGGTDWVGHLARLHRPPPIS